jgi:hypothetical protein
VRAIECTTDAEASAVAPVRAVVFVLLLILLAPLGARAAPTGWCGGIHRLVADGISPEQAVDEAITRIKEILSE